MTDDEQLLFRSRLTIHRQLNPNYCAGAVSSAAFDQRTTEEEADSDKSWERSSGGNVVAKRNARERTRVHTVNQAFLVLKSHLPTLRAHTKRVSKLKILRAAIDYIDDLYDLLKKEEGVITHYRSNHLKVNNSIQSKNQSSMAHGPALADRSLATPLSYPVDVQSLLDTHSYTIYHSHPPNNQQSQPSLSIHPFLLNNYH